jgi:two-component system, NtrC family, response regulator AtoC
MTEYTEISGPADELIQPDGVGTTEDMLWLAMGNRELAIEIIGLLNQRVVEMDVICKIVGLVRRCTGFQAVGIRLRKGDDFPYFVADGFSNEFIKIENSICTRTDYGDVIRDSEGKAVLECMCGEIIQGRSDHSLPFFTVGGSFWTNCRTKLLKSEHGARLRQMVRNRFIAHGYESVAIIPLRFGREIVGLLQFNDTRENRFFPGTVRFFEGIGSLVGIVLSRIEAEEDLRRAKGDLEARVEKRTAELLKAKSLLEEQILERKAVEQELLISRHRLELAMQASNMGSWDWDLNTDEVCFDRRWDNMFGHSTQSESSFGMWQNRIHPDDKLKVLKTLKAHITNPSDYFEAEYRLQAESGEWRWILDRGKVVEYDSNGKPSRMAGIHLDISDRKRVEEQLHETAERFRGIFDSARDCIFVKDPSLKYTQVNPYLANLLDLPTSRIVGRTAADLYGKDSAEILHEVDRRVLNGETVEQEHTRVIKGIPRTFLDTKAPMRNRQGKITGIIGMSREITDRKRTESFIKIAEHDCLSATMESTLHSARMAAQTDTIVLLTGESGAGKDHIARYIHDRSKRSNGPFFSINCAAVSPELAESELFGYESGAFTGSKGPKRGLLELAEGGTILLNEIGELSPTLQAKLLTFLDTRQFTRVGGVRLFTVNARLIAATNRDLQKEVRINRFRQDLFYRLNVFSIEVPPLRQRTEDIPGLVGNITAELSFKLGLDSVPQIDPKTFKALEDYPWPGNVRELRNVLERALILCDKKRINPEDLAVNSKGKSTGPSREWSVSFGFPQSETINDVTMSLKRHLVVEALRRARGSRRRAAELLGISPDSLKHYMQIFDLYALAPSKSGSFK